MSGISQLACQGRADETISADQQDSHRRVDGRLSISHIVTVGRQPLPWDYFRIARYLGTITQVPEMSTSGFGDLSSKNLFRVFSADRKDNPRLVRGDLTN